MAELIEIQFWILSLVDPRNHVLDVGTISHGKGQSWDGRACPDMPDNTLTWTVQNGWTDRFAVWVVECGLRLAGSTSSIIFARQIRLNRPSAAVMQPYVKLLWPLVRPMSHLQFYRDTLSRNFIMRQGCSMQLCMFHTASLLYKQTEQTWLLQTWMMIFLQVV